MYSIYYIQSKRTRIYFWQLNCFRHRHS